MISSIVKVRACVLLAALSFGITSPAVAQFPSKAPQTVADIALYQGADRQQVLLDGARKEGTLTVFHTNPAVPAVAAAFTKKYGIKVAEWRSSSENILQRAVTEARSGRFDVDIIENNSPEMEAIQREQLLQPVNSPYIKDLMPQAVPAHRGWVGMSISMFEPSYNTDQVKKEELPKTFQDLLDPKWKGRLGIETGDITWFAYVLQELGQEKGMKLFRDIVATNGISVRKGHTLMAQLVSSGEVPLALTLFSWNIDQLKDKGAHVARFNIGTAVAHFQGMGMMKKAPHPYASALFYDFMLSDEGQRIVSQLHTMATSNRFDAEDKKAIGKFIDPALAIDENDKWFKQFEDVFIRRQ